MRFPFHRLLMAACIASCVFAGAAATAEKAPDDARSITVQGHGEVETTPDVADVAVGVSARAGTARQALDDSNAAMERLMAALQAAAIAEKDIRTSGFVVSPVYAGAERNAPPHIAGYEAANQVTVTIRDVSRVGTVLDRVVTAGGNSAFGIHYRVAKPEPLLDRARNLAFEDARRRALIYAEAAGAKLGKVLRITEGAARFPTQRYESYAPARTRAVATSPGTQELGVTISVQFELE